MKKGGQGQSPTSNKQGTYYCYPLTNGQSVLPMKYLWVDHPHSRQASWQGVDRWPTQNGFHYFVDVVNFFVCVIILYIC